MIFNARSCDFCKKVTHDEYEDGWIIIGDGGFKKYGGRDSKRMGIVEIFVSDAADFCSWKCLKSMSNKREGGKA